MICSALECELSFINDLAPTEEKNLQNLINDVKKGIKAHRKGSNRLTDKTYDLIFSNIRTWSMTASNKICKLYHRYEKELSFFDPEGTINDERILAYVYYRNGITHGSFRVMDHEIASTAYVLQALVYCCLLTRIGVSREDIFRLCRMKKIIS